MKTMTATISEYSQVPEEDVQCKLKHLMKCYGPQDRTYAALYEAKDAPYVTSLHPIILGTKLEQVYNDHKTALPEIIAISRADDIVTYPGLGHLMRLILGIITMPKFQYMAAGSCLDGSSPPAVIASANPFQQKLINEGGGAPPGSGPRIDMNTAGSYTIVSATTIRYTANFPASHQTMTVRESGVSTSSAIGGGILLNRNVFSNTPINHTSGTAFSLVTDIKFQGL